MRHHPTDEDFMGPHPLLMERPVEVAEERKQTKTNGVRSMPIINFGDYKLDDIPELKVLPAGTETRLRIIDVGMKPDKNGDVMLQVRLDVSNEPEVKDVFWQCHFPTSSMGAKRAVMLKEFLAQFCEAFEIDKTADNDTADWLGKEAWAILGVRSDAKYGDSNEVNRWLKQQ